MTGSDPQLRCPDVVLPSEAEVQAALELLTAAIGGAYQATPVSIEWSNGIQLKIGGQIVRGGINRVAGGLIGVGREA